MIESTNRIDERLQMPTREILAPDQAVLFETGSVEIDLTGASQLIVFFQHPEDIYPNPCSTIWCQAT